MIILEDVFVYPVICPHSSKIGEAKVNGKKKLRDHLWDKTWIPVSVVLLKPISRTRGGGVIYHQTLAHIYYCLFFR